MSCAYSRCRTTRRSHPNLKMFRFPVKDPDRLKKWVAISGNANLLDLDSQQLRNRFICEKHFDDPDFMNRISRNRLTPVAIPRAPASAEDNAFSMATQRPPTDLPSTSKETFPTRSQRTQNVLSPKSPELRVRTPSKTYGKKDFRMVWSSEASEVEVTPDKKNKEDGEFLNKFLQQASTPRVTKRRLKFDEEETPKKKKLKLRLEGQKLQLKRKTSQISYMKKKMTHYKEEAKVTNLLKSFKFPSEHSRALAEMQFKGNKGQWTPAQRNFSLMLYYKSPAAYNFMRNTKVVLPGTSTIRGWLGSNKFMAGFSPRFFTHVKRKFQSKTTTEKACIVCFDEMSIMGKLEFNKALDLIEGFEDLGPLGRKNKIAKYALVFMVRGIHSSWKLPVAYFLSHTGVTYMNLKIILETCLQKLIKAGLRPRAIVCDQGTSNQTMVKSLGVTVEKPFFFVEGQKIFALFDVPHLIKSVRNNLLSGKFQMDDEIVSFQDIRDTYLIDKKKQKARAIPKITDSHISPNPFQKMSVKLAVQVLSNSMAAAIKTCLGTGELKSMTAESTAKFVKFINELFDVLDSRNLFTSNPYKCALSDSNTVAKKVFNEARRIFGNMTKIHNSSNKISRSPCFDGLIQTINAIEGLYAEEKKSENIKFLLTNRLNQDVLENQFAVYRQKGGFNPNPTARLFRTSFRSNAVNMLMQPSRSSNCEPDTDITVDVTASEEDSEQPNASAEAEGSDTTSSSSARVSTPSSSESDSSTTKTAKNTEASVEDCSISYYAGYLGMLCLDEFKCDDCKSVLTVPSSEILSSKKQLLILHRMYERKSAEGGLNVPSEEFINIVDTCLDVFEKVFQKIQYKKCVVARILREIEKRNSVALWLDHPCSPHRLFIIKKLIVTKIYYNCKWLNATKQASVGNIKINPKLKILKHL